MSFTQILAGVAIVGVVNVAGLLIARWYRNVDAKGHALHKVNRGGKR